MGSTSESILLLVPHVKLKKNEGELYLMTERLGWMVGNKDSFSVSHKYCDIKTQKISPEGKPKVQLQVCLHDGSATTFQFVNPAGLAEQIADRDKVKDLLQQLLPKFKRMVNKDLQEKERLLKENPQLAQLYLDLVQSKVISSEEFWTEHATPFIKKQVEARSAQQELGVSASFLSDIKPVTSGCNGGISYNVTPELMASIFRTYPSVKQKHMKCVPDKLSEEEFWIKFFSSHYFHRDKNIADSKDLFTDCGKQDEKELKKEISATNDPLLDLTALHDDKDEEPNALPTNAKASSITHQNMIRRFNQHSILVLKASEQAAGTESTAVEIAPQTKRIRLQEAVSYDDLESKDENHAIPLNLSRIERYLNGPTSLLQSQSGMNGNGSTVSNDLDVNQFQALVARWTRGGGDGYNPADVLSPNVAVNVMGELSTGGSLMRDLSPELQKELKQLYSSLSEILRHFWAAFPPSTPQLIEKVSRMIDVLHRFNQVIIPSTYGKLY
nr:EOG090X04EN [Ilyocryptus agilis]